jgi:REP element-mobilizing transposase RayT
MHFRKIRWREENARELAFGNMVYAAPPMKQQSFFSSAPLFHGGEINRGKRKTRRPLCSKRPLHGVLKAKNHNLYTHKSWIESKARALAQKLHLEVYGLAVNFDHVHLVLKLPNRRAYAAFIRALTGLLARKIGVGLWKLLPFTRVLAWGKDFRQALDYLKKNREEAEGSRPYEERKDWYRRYKPS